MLCTEEHQNIAIILRAEISRETTPIFQACGYELMCQAWSMKGYDYKYKLRDRDLLKEQRCLLWCIKPLLQGIYRDCVPLFKICTKNLFSKGFLLTCIAAEKSWIWTNSNVAGCGWGHQIYHVPPNSLTRKLLQGAGGHVWASAMIRFRSRPRHCGEDKRFSISSREHTCSRQFCSYCSIKTHRAYHVQKTKRTRKSDTLRGQERGIISELNLNK